jgi:hypothetical protein
MIANHHEVLEVVNALHRCLGRREQGRRLAADVDERANLLVLHHLSNDDVANLRTRREVYQETN